MNRWLNPANGVILFAVVLSTGYAIVRGSATMLVLPVALVVMGVLWALVKDL